MNTDPVNKAWVQVTKKYIIDILNILCFSKSLDWSGIDQFNEFIILMDDEDGIRKTQQRGALLVSKTSYIAARLLVTVEDDTYQRVCYRLVGLEEPVSIPELGRKLFPPEYLRLDFSIADSNLGFQQVSSYSFCDNTVNTPDTTEYKRLLSLTQFLLDSFLIVIEDKEVFSSLLPDTANYAPQPGDPHFKPVFSVNCEM